MRLKFARYGERGRERARENTELTRLIRFNHRKYKVLFPAYMANVLIFAKYDSLAARARARCLFREVGLFSSRAPTPFKGGLDALLPENGYDREHRWLCLAAWSRPIILALAYHFSR